MRSEYTNHELSKIFRISKQAIHNKALKLDWKFKIRKNGNGRNCKFYLTQSMDDKTIARLSAVDNTNNDERDPDKTSSGSEPAAALNNRQIKKALAKSDLLRSYAAHLKKAPWGTKEAARNEFIDAYNSGLAFPELHQALGDLSWKTIEQWKRALRAQRDCFALADRRGYWRRHKRIISDEQQKILLRCALHPNRPRLAEVIRMARAVMGTKGIENGFSDATYRRFLNDWRDRNYHIWVFSRQGAKAWNDKCAMYIERDYDLINVGDVLVADGHTLNFEILNPWTGKPKRMILILWLDMKSSFPLGWEIMPTENTQAIASALRRAILRLGKLPQVAYLDNGKAFASRFFNGADLDAKGFSGLFGRLGMKTIFAWPYHGQSKPVERFFGTFAELERWCPTYTGTSIDKKPPRMLRGETLHRRVYQKLTGGAHLTLEQAHRAVATWFDEYARRPHNGHLQGQRPVDVFADGKGPGVDAAELQYLMMSQEVRHIRRNGIHFLGADYYHPQLYGRRQPVEIRYDLQDKSAVWVFERDGSFLCEATLVDKVHPAATALGTDEDRAKLTAHIRQKKSQEKEAAVLARTFVENEVIPEHRRHLKALGISPGAYPDGDQPAKLKISETTAEEERRIMAEVEQRRRWNAELPAKKDDDQRILEEIQDLKLLNENMAADELRLTLERMNESDRYESLMEMDVRGHMIPKKWRAFMQYFELTNDYARHADYFEERRAKLAVVYQTQINSGEIH